MADTAGGGRPRQRRHPWLLDSESSSERGGRKEKRKKLSTRELTVSRESDRPSSGNGILLGSSHMISLLSLLLYYRPACGTSTGRALICPVVDDWDGSSHHHAPLQRCHVGEAARAVAPPPTRARDDVRVDRLAQGFAARASDAHAGERRPGQDGCDMDGL